MVSACAVILFFVLIRSGRVGIVLVGGAFCSSASSLERSDCSSEVDCCVASIISSDHWASRFCGIGNWKRMGPCCLGSAVRLDVAWGGCSSGMRMVVLTPLWSRNAWGMVLVSSLCVAMWWGSNITKWSIRVPCAGMCAGVKVGFCGPSNSTNGSVRRWQDLSEGLVQSPWKSPPPK
jgi:hypothetical protein